tara:strand:+ start:27 stop:458 length:432 start_codon:yes stop_codon:yes gene_type:complete
MWAEDKLVNINIVCLDKKDQVEEGEEKVMWETLWKNFWGYLQEQGVEPRTCDKERVQENFEGARKRHREKKKGEQENLNGARKGHNSTPQSEENFAPRWWMKGYTLSPTIVFVDTEGIPWSIGGKESFRALINSFRKQEVDFG